MSVTRTFTVTVVSTGSGNKYFIDGVQQATILLGEGGTYKFDQSDSTNGSHPLRFATAEDAAGGTQYTTGVTSSGTPGNSGAYTQIVVAESAPDLYYYCTNHGGMGGQANTVDGNSWGIFPWGVNEYGDQDSIDITLTGLSTTSSVGAVEAFPQQGWGRQQWGNSGWGVEYSVELTGQSATTSLGSITTEIAVPLTGLSTTSSIGSLTIEGLTFADLTGVQATTELGDFDNAGTLVGWGRNGWGEEPYGDSFNKLVQPAGLSTTSSVGSLTATPEEIISVTGVSATSAVGSLTTIIDCVVVPTGVSVTSSVGTPLITQATVGLTGLGMTATVGGIVLDAVEIGLTGLEVTSSVGLLQEQISQIPTGQQATSSVGSLVVEIGVPLTGVSATTATGTIVPEDVVGLTGVEAISSVGNIFPLGYGDVDITGNTSYSDVNKTNSASYSDVDVTGNTSYTDVTHVA
jgi:hypothetical protein